MHQNSQNFDSNIHFRPSGLFGGALGAQNGFWVSPGGKSEARALVFFSKRLVLVHLTFLGGVPSQILTLPYYHTPLIMASLMIKVSSIYCVSC